MKSETEYRSLASKPGKQQLMLIRLTPPIIISQQTFTKRIRDGIGEMDVSCLIRRHLPEEPHFSITGAVYRLRINHKRRTKPDLSGAIHSEINRHFPELAHLLKWHLCRVSSGPVGYLRNCLYWYDAVRTPGLSNRQATSCIKAFEQTALWGIVESDVDFTWQNNSRQDVQVYLEKRLPVLVSHFRHDMRKTGLEVRL